MTFDKFLFPIMKTLRRGRRGGGPPQGRRRGRTMSVFWLTPKFFMLGVMDVTSFVGPLEFFYSEASAGMKSIGGAIVFCILGAASWLGSFLIQVVNRATAGQGGGHGWLDGANRNASRLDLFYWLLAGLSFLNFFNYLFWARWYSKSVETTVQVAGVRGGGEQDGQKDISEC